MRCLTTASHLGVFFSILFFATIVRADYYVTGKIRGSECTNYLVVSSCSFVNIDAVAGSDGKLFYLAKRYDEVSEFNGRRCIVRVKSTGAGVWSGVINMFRNVTFFTKKNKKFEEVDIDYLTFPCVRK